MGGGIHWHSFSLAQVWHVQHAKNNAALLLKLWISR